jgi:hypothetical protein
MANTAEAIQYLYPNSVPLRDWLVRSEGGVESVSFWSESLGSQPTAQAIEDAKIPATKASKIAAINAECRARLIARYGEATEQVSRSLGIYGATEKTAMETGIAATIDASNVASNAVLAATTIEAVEAVTVTWPAI